MSVESVVQDIRYAVRVLARSRSFTIAALLTLTVGIGATTSIFSVLYGVVLQPLPYPDPERLVAIWETDLRNGATMINASMPDLRDWQAQSQSFEQMGGFFIRNSTLIDPARDAERVASVMTSPDFFTTTGTRPAIGRAFTADDDRKNAAPVVIISHELWRSRYGGQPILDRSITVDGKPHRVIGVMPPGDDILTGAALWMPFLADTEELETHRGVHNTTVVARLKRGVTIAAAQTEMAAIMARMARVNTDNAGRGVRIQPLRDAVAGPTRPRLLMLAGAVSLVLLIGCINVAGLMLARSNARSRELAVRASLGASRARLARQLFTESLILSLGGAALGVGFAAVATRVLVRMLPTLPRADSVGLHMPVLVFAIFIALLSAMIFGLAPAIRAARKGPFDTLRGRSSDPRRAFGRSVLVVIELALAMVLVVGAALFLASLKRLLDVDPGFTTEHVLTARFQLPAASYPLPAEADYPKWPRVTNLYDELLTKLRATPGVERAALAKMHPFSQAWSAPISIEGIPDPADGTLEEVEIRNVSAGYFDLLGIPLLRGRTFDDRDRPGAPEVIVVNDAFVQRYFPRADPIGKHISIWGRQKEIVGVVRGERFRRLDRAVRPAWYPALAQWPMGGATIVLRVRGDVMQYAGAVRDAVHAIDRNIAVSNIEPVDVQIAQSVATPRIQTVLVTVFGCMALILAAIGLYGLIAYQVQQRTREIGIRVALGASRGEILRLVVEQGLVLALIGISIGLAAAAGATRFIAATLFQISATDPRVFAAVAAMLTFVALMATYVPARRASRIDPSVALRYE